MIEKLTAKNQVAAIHDDVKRVRAGKSPHYGIMEHILLLARRLEAVEAVEAVEAKDTPQ